VSIQATGTPRFWYAESAQPRFASKYARPTFQKCETGHETTVEGFLDANSLILGAIDISCTPYNLATFLNGAF